MCSTKLGSTQYRAAPSTVSQRLSLRRQGAVCRPPSPRLLTPPSLSLLRSLRSLPPIFSPVTLSRTCPPTPHQVSHKAPLSSRNVTGSLDRHLTTRRVTPICPSRSRVLPHPPHTVHHPSAALPTSQTFLLVCLSSSSHPPSLLYFSASPTFTHSIYFSLLVTQSRSYFTFVVASRHRQLSLRRRIPGAIIEVSKSSSAH